MSDYFKHASDLPSGSGFEMFGVCHIMWLIAIAVMAIVFAVIYRRAGKKREMIAKTVGIIMPVISIYRDVVLIALSRYDRYYLPLHLCGMALFIGAIYCFTKWRFVGVVYVLLCVPGAVGALIFPDWTAYPLWNFMHIHDFISHGLIVIWGIALLISKEIIPTWKEFFAPVIFGLAGVVILTPVNYLLGTNYWFLRIPSADSPLVSIMNITGEKWYLAGYILFVTIIVGLWFLLIKCIDALIKKYRK